MIARRVSSLAVALFALAVAAPAFGQAQPTKVGVVNMGKVFNTMQETKDIKAHLEADSASLQTEVQARKAELENLRSKLNNGPKPDSPQFDELASQLEQKSVQYDTDMKLRQIELARNQSKQLKAIFEKIEGVVGDVAKAKGLDLVVTMVRPEFPANVRELTPDAISQLINQRNVMYVNDKIDLTTEVVAALDAKYKSGGK